MGLTSNIIINYGIKPLLEIKSDTTINQVASVVEVDATNQNIVITLGAIDNNTIKNFLMSIKRIDNTSNTVTINGTASNFEDEGYLLGADPQLETITVYASNDNTWRVV